MLVLGVEHLNASVSDDNGEVPLSAQRKTRLSLDMEEYRSTFLATFRSYCTPYVLFELLRKRFCAAVNASREMAIPTIHRSSSQYPSWSMAPHSEPDESVDWDVVSKIRTGVLTVLAAWVKSYAQDFADDPDLFAAWSSFAEHPGVDLVREDAEQARILDTLAELNTSFCVAVMSANTRDEELNGASRANARDSLGTELDFDNASADELVDFLESVASVFYGKILDRDLLVASELLEVQSSDKLGWFVPRKSSAHNGEDEVPTNSMYKLIELLRQPGMGNESATVLQRMPASVRDACAAQNLLRGWTAIQV